MKKLFSVLILLLLHSGLSADRYVPSHSCMKPTKPYEFTDQWQVNNYKNDVQRYKNCIIDFINEQNDAVNNHIDAKNDAIEEWNHFANYGY
jgi:hypothetical protein